MRTASSSSVSDTATGAPDYSYTFDGAGNVRKETKAGNETWYGYDRAGQLCWEHTSDPGSGALVDNCGTATTPGAATDYGQDDGGNSLGTTADPYGYNDFNQVDSIDGVAQKYRDLGNDLRVTTGNTRMVDSSLGVISRTTGTGPTAQATYYLRDPDGALLASYPAMTQTGYKNQAVYYLTNHQDSVVMLLNAGGARVGWYRYSPYGDPTIVEQANGAATENPWRYLSAYYSGENGGYHHLGARMYDNRSHFTQPDPERGNLGEPLRTNAYGYAGADPCNNSDPNGRSWDDLAWWAGMAESCAEGAVGGGLAFAAIGTLIEPGGGTLFAGVLGFAYGCPAGMIYYGVREETPVPPGMPF